MKQELKNLRNSLNICIKELEPFAEFDIIKAIILRDGDFNESASTVITSWIPRGEYMVKRLDRIIEKLPKERKTRKKNAKKEV